MIKNLKDFKLGVGFIAFCLFCLFYLIPNQVGGISESESLLPILITIFIAAGSNLFRNEKSTISRRPTKYIFSAIFGIIQGFGLADYFTNIIGVNRRITLPLIAYNLGIELGYLLVVFLYLIVSWIFVNNLGVSKKVWYLVISSAIAGIALTFMYETRYWVE